MQVFFTYIYANDDAYTYGDPANQGWPLTFGSEAARSTARNMITAGDLVFGIVSSTPGHDIVVPERFKGRVVAAWHITRQNALLTDYDLELRDFDLKWPVALQPIRTWEIADPPRFRDLDGYDSETHTPRSISSVETVNETLARSMIATLRDHGAEVRLPRFRYPAMEQRNAQLRQRHPFRIEGHVVGPVDAEKPNHVYIATLGKGSRTLKIGHSTDPAERVASLNKYRLSSEPQWILHTAQPMGTVQQAIKAEATLGELFAKFRTEQNNNEVFVGLSAIDVLTRLATMR